MMNTADQTEVSRGVGRHSPTNGPDQEHYGENVPGCLGCDWRAARAEQARIQRADATTRPVVYRSGDRFGVIDLHGPFVDIVDALVDLGLTSNRAEDEAWRLVQ